MRKYESRENYLVMIYILGKREKTIFPIDISEAMNYKLPSVSYMLKTLLEDKLIKRGDSGEIYLTDKGRSIAESRYKSRCFFRELLLKSGVEKKIADEEACYLEHGLSEDSFKKLCDYLKKNYN